MEQYKEMKYMTAVENFIHNDNTTWLEAIRQNKVTVKCKFDYRSDHTHITFRVHLEELQRGAETEHQAIRLLFKEWGILGLLREGAVDCHVRYTEKHKQVVGKDQVTTTKSRVFRIAVEPGRE